MEAGISSLPPEIGHLGEKVVGEAVGCGSPLCWCHPPHWGRDSRSCGPSSCAWGRPQQAMKGARGLPYAPPAINSTCLCNLLKKVIKLVSLACKLGLQNTRMTFCEQSLKIKQIKCMFFVINALGSSNWAYWSLGLLEPCRLRK